VARGCCAPDLVAVSDPHLIADAVLSILDDLALHPAGLPSDNRLPQHHDEPPRSKLIRVARD
jgi:hypothetical protein